MSTFRERWAAGGLFLLALGLVFVAGCLPFPVGDPAKSKIDPSLTGYWRSTKEDDQMLVMIAPFDEHAYVVQTIALKKQDEASKVEEMTLMKGWLTELKGQTFMTLDSLSAGTDFKDKKYPALKLVHEADKSLKVMLVNPEFEGLKTAPDAAAMTAIIEKEIDNPKLYGDPLSYQRLDPEKDKALIELFSKPAK